MPASREGKDVKPAAARERMKLTYDDFLLFPDDGKRHELIDGEHYVTPWLESHTAGQVFYAPFDVVISRFDVVEPDLLYISSEKLAVILTAQHVAGTPDLVVEIASAGTRKRDETIKRRLYERSGVVEYWVIDPELDLGRVYRRAGESFSRPDELSRDAGDVLATPLLPGLHLPLARIFG